MTTVKIFRNKRNHNKYIEVHNDGHYHNALVQFLYWNRTNVTYKTGDRCLHRWHKNDLNVLMEDYEPIPESLSKWLLARRKEPCLLEK